MTTKSIRTNMLRLAKLFTITAALALGSGFGSAQAAALTKKQAESAANLILSTPAALRYNAAFTTAKDLTAGTGAEFAAINAKLIANNIPDGQLVALLPAILKGVAVNYPNQLPAIAAQLIALNDTTRDHAVQLVASIAPLAGSNYSSQLAVVLNLQMRKHEDLQKKAAVIAAILFTNISNSSTGTAEERAYELGVAAGNLANSLTTTLNCDPKLGKKAFNQISWVLSFFIQSVPTGSLTRAQIAYYIAGNYTATLKNNLPPGSSAATITALVTQAQTTINQQLVTTGNNDLVTEVNKAVTVVIDTPQPNPFPTGPVGPVVTPH